MTRDIMQTAFSGWGAKLGMAWVLILAFVACFAPLLANSMPLALSRNGQLEFPILRYLTGFDVALMLAFVLVLVVWKLRLSFGKKLLVVGIPTALSLIIGLLALNPPKTVIYEQYRSEAAAGAYDWQQLPPIPYSPSDYLRDYSETSLNAPLDRPERHHLMGTDTAGSDVANGYFDVYRHYYRWADGLFLRAL